jgi:hypothetical protein
MMSPQGIMPDAQSVVVMAVHHPDGCVEMGGEPESQNIGPYAVQYTMNSMLDEISFNMGKFLEYEGYASIPIVSSNIWRYRGYRGLRENFAPDVSHIHAAIAAGLAVFGYSGLALTPEYGPRVRFVQACAENTALHKHLSKRSMVCMRSILKIRFTHMQTKTCGAAHGESILTLILILRFRSMLLKRLSLMP